MNDATIAGGPPGLMVALGALKPCRGLPTKVAPSMT